MARYNVQLDSALYSIVKGIKREAYTRQSPEIFAPFNRIEQRDLTGYMSKRRPINNDFGAVAGLTVETQMPAGMLDKIRLYQTIFDHVDVVWYKSADGTIIDSALVGFFWHGASKVGGGGSGNLSGSTGWVMTSSGSFFS